MSEPITADEIRESLRYFGINHEPDALWINEFCFGDFRYDMLTVDLRSWMVRGYEVKISHDDFAGDKKWQNYLPHVNHFFFAAPRGVIQPRELPPEVGLVEAERGTDGAIELRLAKRSRILQPCFARRTLGEDHVVRLLTRYLRDINWRETRMSHCRKCLKRLETDGRTGGIMREANG